MSATASPALLVATKVQVPEPRPELVSRRELVGCPVDGDARRLVLVCAPAGWGKSVLLGEWHASGDETRPFAWVSLDPGDDDPVRFWSYLIGALQTVEPELGGQALVTLECPRFRGHLSAWSALSDQAGRIGVHGETNQSLEAVPAGVSA